MSARHARLGSITAVLIVVGLVALVALRAWGQQTDIPLPGGVLMKKPVASLGPVANAATNQPLFTNTSFEQTFTVTGLDPRDAVFINGPAPTAACPMIGARVSAANTLAIQFAKITTALCTPASGTYTIYSLRVNP